MEFTGFWARHNGSDWTHILHIEIGIRIPFIQVFLAK